jgi:hypothetical protein
MKCHGQPDCFEEGRYCRECHKALLLNSNINVRASLLREIAGAFLREAATGDGWDIFRDLIDEHCRQRELEAAEVVTALRSLLGEGDS